MSNQDQDQKHLRDTPLAEVAADEPGTDGSRRELIRSMGLAAAVAPAMVVLLRGESKATPVCDNPAWQLGLNRAGHSGC